MVCVSKGVCGVGCEVVGSRAMSCCKAGVVLLRLEELFICCRVSQSNITLLDSCATPEVTGQIDDHFDRDDDDDVCSTR